jgi:hypothetical protein
MVHICPPPGRIDALRRPVPLFRTSPTSPQVVVRFSRLNPLFCGYPRNETQHVVFRSSKQLRTVPFHARADGSRQQFPNRFPPAASHASHPRRTRRKRPFAPRGKSFASPHRLRRLHPIHLEREVARPAPTACAVCTPLASPPPAASSAPRSPHRTGCKFYRLACRRLTAIQLLSLTGARLSRRHRRDL